MGCYFRFAQVGNSYAKDMTQRVAPGFAVPRQQQPVKTPTKAKSAPKRAAGKAKAAAKGPPKKRAVSFLALYFRSLKFCRDIVLLGRLTSTRCCSLGFACLHLMTSGYYSGFSLDLSESLTGSGVRNFSWTERGPRPYPTYILAIASPSSRVAMWKSQNKKN